jgi:outer membrane protein
MHKFVKSFLVLSVAGLFTAAVQAQPAPKILVVDMVKLYDGHFKTEEQNAKLKVDQQKAEDELQKLNAEGNALVKQAQELQEQLKNATLTDAAKTTAQKDLQAKAEEIQKKQNEVNSFRQNTQRSLQQRINTFKQLLLEEISKTATDIAKKKGATLLFDKSGPSLIGVPSLVFFDASYDITDDVAKEINKDRPAGGSASSAPASSGAAPSVSFPGSKK